MKVSIRRITYDIEAEGTEVAPLFLEKVIGTYIPMRKFRLEHVVEINLYGEADNIVVIGECKNRIGPSSIVEVLEKALKLSKHIPSIKARKIVLIVYGIEYIEIARDFAEQAGVAIITTRGMITEPIEQSLEQVKDSYRRLLEKLKK